jgi:hypothetical protein
LLCIELFVAGALFLAAMSRMCHTAHGLSGLGEGIGALFGATAAGISLAWARVRGEPTAGVQDALTESAVISTVESETPEPVVSQLKLNYTLDAMVMGAHEGKPISRDALVGGGVTTQQYWNLANHVLKLLGLRQEKSTKWFGRGSSEEDIRFVRHNLKVVDDVVLVREGGRNGWKRVDLVDANFIVP